MKNNELTIEQRQISIFRTARDVANPYHGCVGAVINRIRTGANGLADDTALMHEIVAADGKSTQYSEIKIGLPAVAFGGTFSYRNNDSLIKQSGLICMDVDGFLNKDKAVAVRDYLFANIQSVVFAFISPSGIGVKVIFALREPTDKDTNEYAWQACDAILKSELSEFGLEHETDYAIDGTQDVSRLCFLSHDTLAPSREPLERVDWSEQKRLGEQAKAKRERERAERQAIRNTSGVGTGDLPISVLGKSDPTPFLRSLGLEERGEGRDGWINWGRIEKSRDIALGVRLSPSGNWNCKVFAESLNLPPTTTKSVSFARWYCWVEFGVDIDGLDAQSQAFKDVNKRLADLGYGTWMDEAEFQKKAQASRKTSERKPRVKLVKPLEVIENTSIENTRKAIQAGYEESTGEHGKRITIMRFDAGAGKSEQALHFIEQRRGKVLFGLPTHDLGGEMAQRYETLTAELEQAGLSYQWRGLGYENGEGFPHQAPCSKPELAIAYAQHGGTRKLGICAYCEDADICEVYGYNSQERRIKEESPDVVFFADSYAFFDKRRHGYVKRLLPSKRNPVCIIDEFDVARAFPEYRFTLERLRAVLENWNHHAVQAFCKSLIRAVSENTEMDINAIKEAVEATEGHEKPIHEALCHVAIGNETFTLDGSIRGGYKAPPRTKSDVTDNLPMLDREGWTLLHQLKAFFKRYPYTYNAPMRLIRASGEPKEVVFALPPQLATSGALNSARYLIQSATIDTELVRRAFSEDEVGVIDGKATAWHEGAKVYQLETNRNPRATALLKEKGKKPYDTRLSEEERNTEAEQTELRASGKATMDRALMHIQNNTAGQVGLISYKSVMEVYQAELEKAGVPVANFGNLQGLDTRFQECTDLHVVFSQQPPPHEIEWQSQLLYGNDAEPLTFERDTEGVYTDERVHRVAMNIQAAEMIQAIGRLRQVNRAGRVFLWSSYAIPSITNRAETTLFREEDFDKALELDATAIPIDEAIAMRLEQETAAAADRKRIDDEAIQRRKNNARIFRLARAGMSKNEIATTFNITPRQVYRILKEVARGLIEKIDIGHHFHEEYSTMYSKIMSNSDVACFREGNVDMFSGDGDTANSGNVDMFSGNVDNRNVDNPSEVKSRNVDKRRGVQMKYHKQYRERILAFAQSQASEFRTKDVVEAVEGARQNITSELSKMVTEGLLERVKKGYYRVKAMETDLQTEPIETDNIEMLRAWLRTSERKPYKPILWSEFLFREPEPEPPKDSERSSAKTAMEADASVADFETATDIQIPKVTEPNVAAVEQPTLTGEALEHRAPIREAILQSVSEGCYPDWHIPNMARELLRSSGIWKMRPPLKPISDVFLAMVSAGELKVVKGHVVFA